MEKLKSLDDQQIQEWLRKIDPTTLAAALVAASDTVRKRVYRNLSTNAAGVLARTVRGYELLDAKELVIQMAADRLEALL